MESLVDLIDSVDQYYSFSASSIEMNWFSWAVFQFQYIQYHNQLIQLSSTSLSIFHITINWFSWPVLQLLIDFMSNLIDLVKQYNDFAILSIPIDLGKECNDFATFSIQISWIS